MSDRRRRIAEIAELLAVVFDDNDWHYGGGADSPRMKPGAGYLALMIAGLIADLQQRDHQSISTGRILVRRDEEEGSGEEFRVFLDLGNVDMDAV